MLPQTASTSNEQEEEEEQEEQEAQGEHDGQEDGLVVPQVKVAEDGSLIIDEERSVRFKTQDNRFTFRRIPSDVCFFLLLYICFIGDVETIFWSNYILSTCPSLTVEVQRAKGPNPAQDKDPIFERGSTTTYSSFRKGTSPKPWSSEG